MHFLTKNQQKRHALLFKARYLLLVLALALLPLLAGCEMVGVSSATDPTALFSAVSSQRTTSGGASSSEISSQGKAAATKASSRAEAAVTEKGTYSSKDEVALYLSLYGHLPSNFITKKQAQELGWSGGSLEPYAPGKSIGGSHYGNYEGLLPEKKGRHYTECDIDTAGKKSRGAKRIVFSNDGLIYYTEDHYESFELLYGEE